MWTHFRISNFALLDDVELELQPGFNVLTGETGAGKSLLVEAVALLRGGRASAEVVRSDAEEARVEAVFEPPHGPAAEALAERLERVGIEAAEEGLIVRRIIGRTGRSRVYINHTLCTAAALSEVAGVLIELAGQHEHQTLSDPAEHLAILDHYGGHGALLVEMREAYEKLRAVASELDRLNASEREQGDREELLRFQLRELEEAELEPGEDVRLKEERERLRAAERLVGAARRGEEALYARERAVVEELGSLARELGEVGKIDERLARAGRQVEDARLILEEVARELGRFAGSFSADPERLEEVEDRLDALNQLLRKHRSNAREVADLIAHREALATQLGGLPLKEERRAQLEAALSRARERAVALATQLEEARRRAATTLSERVGALLAELSMPGARLSVVVAPVAPREGDLADAGRRLGPTGWDRVEFMLAANRGEEPRPLRRVASGGELSRIMLALKRILSRADQVATYVFDEVDAGIGGAVADVVARQIRAVAADKQVVCITHLAQIAAHAGTHFRVEKTEERGRVRTDVRRLSAAARIDEIARMLGGATTAAARAHAEELLRAAEDLATEARPRTAGRRRNVAPRAAT